MEDYLLVASSSFDGLGLVDVFKQDFRERERRETTAKLPAQADFSSGAARFTLAMHQHSLSLVPVILEKFKDLPRQWGFSSFLDVAGGSAVIWYPHRVFHFFNDTPLVLR
jgi:hypothetical protein